MNYERWDLSQGAKKPTRRAPSEPTELRLPFDGSGTIPDDPALQALGLSIEATNQDGELASWLSDQWWTGVIQRWIDCQVTVRILPTPEATLHPVILHQLEMLRRVAPGWRLIGNAYVDDLASEQDIETAARCWYHELRLIDQRRPGSSRSNQLLPLRSIAALISDIRQEQVAWGVSTPILVRMPVPGRACTMATAEVVSDRALMTGSPDPRDVLPQPTT